MKKALLKLRDMVEVLFPICTFSILFITFVYAVVCRYVFNRPPAWGTEVQVATYIWTVLLGSCYIRRMDKHVKFTMVYDLLSEKGKRIMRIFRNTLMGVTYAILLPHTISYIAKYRTMSPSLKLPMKLYFAPIIVLVFGVMCYSFADVYKDVRELVKPKKPSEGANV